MKNYFLYTKLSILFIILITSISCSTSTKKSECYQNPDETRSTSSINCHISNLSPRINYYYNRILKKHPNTKGVIKFKIFIKSNGLVGNVIILSNSTGSKALALKTSALFRTRNYGISKNATTITYPLTFKP